MNKFDIIKQQETNGINYEISNEDIIVKLQDWDLQYGIEISDAAHDSVLVTFNSLPMDLESLAKDIYEFCPDIIEQHFGVMDEMIETMEETGQELDEETARFIEGIDFEDENFGMVLLQRSLAATKTVALWWD